MSNTHWDHYERYSSVYGSVSKEEGGEWVGRVNIKAKKSQARLKETFTSAAVAMSAVVRTWQRENEDINKRPVVAKLVQIRRYKERLRLIAETLEGPDGMIGHALEIIMKGDDTQIQAMYDLLRQMQLERLPEMEKIAK